MFELVSHRDRFLDVGNLGLKDGEAAIDDSTLFELLTLFACGVLGKHGCGTFANEGSSVDRAEGECSDRAGEGLNRLVRVEGYFSHSCLIFRCPNNIRTQ